MKIFLNVDKTPSFIKKSKEAAIKLSIKLTTHIRMESIPFMELPSLAKHIHAKIKSITKY